MKTKSKIEQQLQKKTNQVLIETIIVAKKKEKWIEVATVLSGSRRNRNNINLDELNKNAKGGEKIVVLGKILSSGEIDKKIKIVAMGFSEMARDKLLKAGCEVFTILEEIKKNPNAEGLRILKTKSEDFNLSKLNKSANLNK